MNRLNKYADMWESQERAMRSAPYARTVEWDLNTSPPMQWHFGPPPAGWGSYLAGAPSSRGGLRGLGAVFQIGQVDPGIRDLQVQLARLGFLFNEEGPQGIDGRWGSRTELALRHAANYVRFTGTPSVVAAGARGEAGFVDVADELITAIRNAPAAPAGTTGLVSSEGPATGETSSESSGGMGIALVFLAAVAAAGYYYGRR